jgi:hypothetical protein
MAGIISRYLHIDPDKLTDTEFGAKFQQADWIRRNPEKFPVKVI